MHHLVPRDFFGRDLVDRMLEEMEKEFARPLGSVLSLVPQGRWPAVDVKERDKDIVVELEVPGVDPAKVDVSVEGEYLRVRGEHEEKKEERDKEKGYWRKEIYRGSFSRVVPLPAAVKDSGGSATYEKGVLRVTLPKAEPVKSKPIKVIVKTSAKKKK